MTGDGAKSAGTGDVAADTANGEEDADTRAARDVEDDLDFPELRTKQWDAHDAELADTSFRVMVRRLPALVLQALSVAWEASRVDTALACGLQVASGVFTAFGLLATRGVLQALFAEGPTPDRVRAAVPSMALVGTAAVLRGGLQVGAGWAQGRLSPRVDRVVRIRLFEATTRVRLASFDDSDFFAALQRANIRGADSAARVVDTTVDTVTATVGLVAVAGTLGVLHPVLLPLLAAAAVPRGWAAVRAARMRYVSMYQRTMIRRRMWMLGWLMTGRDTAADLRAFTMRDFLLGQYSRLTDRDLRADLAVTTQQSITRAVGDMLSGLATVLVYVSLGLLLATGHMPLAIAGTAVLAIQTGQSQLGYLVVAVNQLYEEGLYFTDYLAFLGDADTRSPVAGEPAPRHFERVTVDAVSFTYPGAERPALDDVSLTIHSGQVVALVGENGSGKSTLAKLVAGLYHPDRGRICWDDIDVSRVDPDSLSARIAVITQDYARWPFTARQNISLGADVDSISPVVAAARASGADEVIDGLPQRYETLLDRSFAAGVDLSGGQWQRLAIARGFHRDTPVLICDEPTAALDARAEHALYSRLRELAQGRTVILITHRLASVRQADHIYVLHNGRIEDHGSHDELLGRGGRYATLYTMQASAYAPDAATDGTAPEGGGPIDQPVEPSGATAGTPAASAGAQ